MFWEPKTNIPWLFSAGLIWYHSKMLLHFKCALSVEMFFFLFFSSSLGFLDCDCELPAWPSAAVSHLQLHGLLKIHLRENEKLRIWYVLVTTVKRPRDSKNFCWLTVCPTLLFFQGLFFSSVITVSLVLCNVFILQIENQNVHSSTASLRATFCELNQSDRRLRWEFLREPALKEIY